MEHMIKVSENVPTYVLLVCRRYSKYKHIHGSIVACPPDVLREDTEELDGNQQDFQ